VIESGMQGAERYSRLVADELSGGDPSTAEALLSDIQDYFYYAEISSRARSEEERKLDFCIPLSEVPSVMRAIGFYPSEGDIKAMQKEVEHAAGGDGSVLFINLERFLQLFFNYRPVADLELEAIEKVFKVMSEGASSALGHKMDSRRQSPVDRETHIPVAELEDLLMSTGEIMSKNELKQCLVALCGTESLSEALGTSDDPHATVTAADFADKVLGLEQEA